MSLARQKLRNSSANADISSMGIRAFATQIGLVTALAHLSAPAFAQKASLTRKCTQEFAQFVKEAPLLAVALPISLAVHTGLIASRGIKESAQKINAPEKEAEPEKELDDEPVELRSEADLIREAQENLRAWKAHKKLKTNMADFLVHAEIDRETPLLNRRFRETQRGMAKAQALTRALEKKGGGVLAKALRFREELFSKYLTHYCRSFARYPNVYEKCGNCEAQTKFVISHFLDQGVSLPPRYKLGVQFLPQHMQPVLYDSLHGTVYDYISGEQTSTVDGTIYEPAVIYCAFLQQRKAEVPLDCQKDLLIADVKDPAEKGVYRGVSGLKTNSEFDYSKMGKYRKGLDPNSAPPEFAILKFRGLGWRRASGRFRSPLEAKNAKRSRYEFSVFPLPANQAPDYGWASFSGRDKEESLYIYTSLPADSYRQFTAMTSDDEKANYLAAQLVKLGSDSFTPEVEAQLWQMIDDQAQGISAENLKRILAKIRIAGRIFTSMTAIQRSQGWGDLSDPLSSHPRLKALSQLRDAFEKNMRKNPEKWIESFSRMPRGKFEQILELFAHQRIPYFSQEQQEVRHQGPSVVEALAPYLLDPRFLSVREEIEVGNREDNGDSSSSLLEARKQRSELEKRMSVILTAEPNSFLYESAKNSSVNSGATNAARGMSADRLARMVREMVPLDVRGHTINKEVRRLIRERWNVAMVPAFARSLDTFDPEGGLEYLKATFFNADYSAQVQDLAFRQARGFSKLLKIQVSDPTEPSLGGLHGLVLPVEFAEILTRQLKSIQSEANSPSPELSNLKLEFIDR